MEELETEIDGILINGANSIKFSDDGRPVTHFKMMVRPVEATKLLQRLTGEQPARH
jgi:septum formation inhibitor-activating ATPase MinD